MLHIFDVDYTVIKKSSAGCFVREAMSKGIIRLSQMRQLPLEWIKYKLGRPNMSFIEEAVKHLAGLDQNILEQTARDCFERYMKPCIYTGAAKLVKEALDRGEKVIFATSSLYTIIQPLECFLGIKGSLATMLEFCDGKASGKVTGNSLFGPQKKVVVEKWLGENGLSPAEVCFYSDSYTDIPLLEFCGKPVAVNPDRILAREAKKQGWEILRFTEIFGSLSEI